MKLRLWVILLEHDSISMPRSPVKRPPADVDLSGILRTVDQLPPVLSSKTLFNNDHPLEIEVGSGKGLFLSTASQASPGNRPGGRGDFGKVRRSLRRANSSSRCEQRNDD